MERVSLGYNRLTKTSLFKTRSPITIRHRALHGMTDYNAPDPREQYAVPKTQVTGTLPERIFYKALNDLHLQDGVDFDFQSSLAGGRIILGGLVVDFLFRRPPLAVRIQGKYWHGEFDRENGNLMHGDIVQGRRDDEQGMELNENGFAVLDLWEDTCDDPYLLKYWMARWIIPMLAGVG